MEPTHALFGQGWMMQMTGTGKQAKREDLCPKCAGFADVNGTKERRENIAVPD
jgi:hypothetical protein